MWDDRKTVIAREFRSLKDVVQTDIASTKNSSGVSGTKLCENKHVKYLEAIGWSIFKVWMSHIYTI